MHEIGRGFDSISARVHGREREGHVARVWIQGRIGDLEDAGGRRINKYATESVGAPTDIVSSFDREHIPGRASDVEEVIIILGILGWAFHQSRVNSPGAGNLHGIRGLIDQSGRIVGGLIADHAQAEAGRCRQRDGKKILDVRSAPATPGVVPADLVREPRAGS